MKKVLRIPLLTILSWITFTHSNGQSHEVLHSDSILELQEVAVYGNRWKDSTNAIGSQRMEVFNRMNAAQALNVLPGVSLSNFGARNEATIFVRGFDLRQVPVFIDGVPIYVPYDGYVDLARFTTFDLAEINVSKGFSSVLYGPNTLGGAINLISRKPVEKIEFTGATGYLTGGYRSNLNVGSKIGKFYVQAGLSQLSRDYFNLSERFDSVSHENGGRRDNSYSKDIKYSIRVGFTPTAKQEYVFSYMNQQGEKGTPVYAGTDTKNSLYTKPRYWKWPYWNKESFYFLSNTTIDSSNYIRLRLYYDKFKNLLESYDDDKYSAMTKPYAFQSYYNDDTYGGSIEYGTKLIPKNQLKFAAHYKHDRHRENNANEAIRTFEDNTISFGLENIYQPLERLKIIPGISYNLRSSVTAQDYNSTTKVISNFPSNSNDAWNMQLGAFYNLTSTSILSVCVSNKSRFATVKDRYSYRLGTAIPNPDLQAEYSTNYELSYSNVFIQKIRIQGSLFYSNISNTIQNVNNIQPGRSQLQNTGTAEFMGLEASLDYALLKKLSIGANYTFIERHNLSNPDIKFTDVPNDKLFAYVQYRPLKGSYIMASSEYNTQRYSSSYGTSSAEFWVLNTKASLQLWKYIALEGGVNNILDRNYSLAEGYPEQGRNYFISLVYRSF